MSEYSKSHEREEREKMGRGLWHSIFGLLFCWVPVMGLALAISGFLRQMVRLTIKHRTRLTIYLTLSIVSVVICVGILIGEAFLYSRNPNFLNDIGHIVWEALTGQTQYAWEQSESFNGGFDYSGYTQPGLGVMEGQEFAPLEEEPVPEDDVYYGDEEGIDPNAEDSTAGGEDQDALETEFTGEEEFNGEFDDVDGSSTDGLPSIKDIVDEMKDPAGILQGGF